MPVSLTTLTGPIYMPNGATPIGGRVSFELSSWDREEGEALIVSGPTYSNIDENGQFSVELFTTTEGVNTVNYRMYVLWEDSTLSQSYVNDVYVSSPVPHYTKKYIGSFALAGAGPFQVSDLNIVSELELNSFDVLLECQAYTLAAEEAAAASAADRLQTGLDTDATAADRVQTGLDRVATAADSVATGLDTDATAADRVQTGLDAAATAADAIDTAADRVQTGLDAAATEADAIATAADRIQTGLDKNAAAGSATAANSSYVDFDKKYLGPKAAAPTTNNQGGALVTGALYFDTTLNAMRIRSGTNWITLSIAGALLAASNLSDVNDPALARKNLRIYDTLAQFYADTTVLPLNSYVFTIAEGASFQIVASNAGNRINHPVNTRGLNVLPVSGNYDARLFGATRNGTADDAPMIQKAIDAAAAITGGRIFLGDGVWTLKSQLTLKSGCHLEGVGYSFDGNTFYIRGTVLEVRWGNGVGYGNDATKAAIIVQPGSTIRRLAFNYPLVADNFTPDEYGATVKMYLPTTAALSPYHSNCELEDLFFYRAYNPIDARGSKSRTSGNGAITTHRYTNILMVATRFGLRLDNVTDWCFFDKIEQQPGLVSHNANPTTSLRGYIQKNCVFLELAGLLDWVNFDRCTAWACNVAAGLDGVQGPIVFNSCSFDGIRIPISPKGTMWESRLRFVNCTFTAFDTVQFTAGLGQYSSFVFVPEPNCKLGQISFTNCFLFGPSKGWMWCGNSGVGGYDFLFTGNMTAISGAVGGSGSALESISGLNNIIVTNNFFNGCVNIHSGTPTGLQLANNHI